MKNFVASYSGGKDSVLAIYRSISSGMNPIALITTYNIDKKRSWFHGIPQKVLDSLSESLNIPVWLIQTSGSEYTINFEKTLQKAKNMGADSCVFGDIDIEEHFKWCIQRCNNVGIEAVFPLRGEIRKNLVYEFIDSGFTSNITVINTEKMDEKFLGEKLTRNTVDMIESEGVDICGENGEYHSFVSNGPIFKQKVQFVFGEKMFQDGYAVLPVLEK